jgi:hypothetical protein
MRVLGLLNGIHDSIALDSIEPYIHNWSNAAKGKDMSVQTGSNLRTGFSDPAIIRRQ